MILVTVGTHLQGFERLVQSMDKLADELDEHVVIQFGSSRYVPHNAEGFNYASSQVMEKLTEEARIVVCHAAAGSILTALRHFKPVVAVPRLKRYGEVIDDHQLQLARVLDSQGIALAVYEVNTENLAAALQRAGSGQRGLDRDGELVAALKARLGEWEAGC